jgi:hypothetical protein
VRTEEQRKLLLPFVPEENHKRIRILSQENTYLDLVTAADELKNDFKLRGVVYYVAGFQEEHVHTSVTQTLLIENFFSGVNKYLQELGFRITDKDSLARSWREATEILHSA